MTFLNKKRINTELFIDWNKELYVHKGDKEWINKILDLLEEGELKWQEK